MQAALGMLRWPPAAFWAATPHELLAAIEGLEAQMPRSGGGPSTSPRMKGRGGRGAPLTRGEFEALRARFPDRL